MLERSAFRSWSGLAPIEFLLDSGLERSSFFVLYLWSKGEVEMSATLTKTIELEKPHGAVPKEWEAKQKNGTTYQGKIYTVGGAVEYGFSFSIMTSQTGATFFGIDLTKKYADTAVRVVLEAFEKGAALLVVEDATSPGYAAIVVAY
jgi:hypothetical protein